MHTGNALIKTKTKNKNTKQNSSVEKQTNKIKLKKKKQQYCHVFMTSKNTACLSQLGIWWLQWYFPKQIPIICSCINSSTCFLSPSVPQIQKQAKPKVISDTYMYLHGRRLFLAAHHYVGTLSPVLCEMELLNHLISMAAPEKYRSIVLWLDMHKDIHTLLYSKGDKYTIS